MHSFTPTQFNRLTPSDRYDTLERQGTYLQAYYLEHSFKVALFDLNGLYVAVWLNQATDELWKAEAFEDYRRLDPFLKSIDLSSLYCNR